MAHKDYVGRGRSQAKAAPPKKPFPVVALVVVLVLVGGFGYFLWSVKGTAEKTTTTENISVAKEDALPEMQEDDWTYQKELEKKNVEVDVPERQASNKKWTLQCGSFKTQAGADSMKARIAFQGLTAKVLKQSDSQWYRVTLGPYDRKREAEHDRNLIRKIPINTCRIW